MAELKTDVAELKTDVAELKTDVAELKTDVAELKTDVKHLNHKMDAVYEQTGGLSEFRTVTLYELREIKENQKSILEIIAEHDVQIRNLRRQSG